MLEDYFRPIYQGLLLDPVVLYIKKWGLNPNFLTLIGCISGLSVFFALYFHAWLLGTLLLLLSGYFDTLDGLYAREINQSSKLGTVYDILADRLVESAVILGLFIIDPESRAVLCLLMLASVLICVTSFLVVGIFAENNSQKSFYYSPGLIERLEAFIFFIAMIWLNNYFSILAITFTVLVLLTAYLRVRQFNHYEHSKGIIHGNSTIFNTE